MTEYLTWKTHKDADDSRAILKKWIRDYKYRDYYQWAIVPKNSTEPIGCIAAVDLDDETSCVQIGYCLGKTWWRQGIMTEALRAVIRFFFEETGARRIEGRHDVKNPHSGMVMQKCGMRYEGTLRGAGRNNQGICDVCVYGLLQEDEREGK